MSHKEIRKTSRQSIIRATNPKVALACRLSVAECFFPDGFCQVPPIDPEFFLDGLRLFQYGFRVVHDCREVLG